MSSNIREFSVSLGRHAEQVPERVAQIHRALHLEALRGVILASPVDTGRFRGNWQASVGEPASGTLDVEDKTGGPTISKGSQVASQIVAYSMSWIVNNLPYAVPLETGHSRQAPAGMVTVTAARLQMRFQA